MSETTDAIAQELEWLEAKANYHSPANCWKDLIAVIRYQWEHIDEWVPADITIHIEKEILAMLLGMTTPCAETNLSGSMSQSKGIALSGEVTPSQQSTGDQLTTGKTVAGPSDGNEAGHRIMRESSASPAQSLSPAQEKLCDGYNQVWNVNPEQLRQFLREALAAQQPRAWVPVSTPPTEKDADDCGRVAWWRDTYSFCHSWTYVPLDATHWHPLPKLQQPDPDADEAEFDAWEKSVCSTGDLPPTYRDCWQAAVKAARQQKA